MQYQSTQFRASSMQGLTITRMFVPSLLLVHICKLYFISAYMCKIDWFLHIWPQKCIAIYLNLAYKKITLHRKNRGNKAYLEYYFFGPCLTSELWQTGAVTRNSQPLREGDFGSCQDSNPSELLYMIYSLFKTPFDFVFNLCENNTLLKYYLH